MILNHISSLTKNNKKGDGRNRKNAKFVRLTNSGITESHVHGVQVTKEAPNYRSN